MPVTYQAWLVLLSIVMAIQGAYVGLSLAVQITDATGVRRRLLLAGASASLAVAIWTMHFVGMLAVRLPFQVDYLVLPTLLSFLVCAIVVGAAVYATSSGPLTLLRLTLSSCLMGGGIFTMHYIGMSALDASTYMIHDPVYVASSMAIAIAVSGLTLWLATGRGGRPPLILSAIVFGFAVSGMHYTAMTGVTLYPYVAASSGAPALSTDFLAIIVAVVAFGISGIFLLLLLPDSSRAGSQPVAVAAGDASTSAAQAAAAPLPAPAAMDGDNPEFGRGTYAPLGGAGAPPRRFARHLPIERDGGTHFLAVDDVVAIHANAHYTYVFDGNDKLFCPLAIGNVESRLDNDRFVRVHRSHIVNIDRIVGYKRSGDNELVELASAHHYLVPVSRSRIGTLKSRVTALAGADAAISLRRRRRFASR
ncbi:MAG TPA: MHYT domain-containing protein [Xanthobacteraceae bacterium]|nr:MHYT domain-containing protein [Xanthobacteraceae bacterium]